MKPTNSPVAVLLAVGSVLSSLAAELTYPVVGTRQTQSYDNSHAIAGPLSGRCCGLSVTDAAQ